MTIALLRNNKKNRKRKGRGNASGIGGECGRGHKGQKSRAGYSKRSGFEGGQTPLYRRLPKKNGFNNSRFNEKYDVVNLSDIEQILETKEITGETLKKSGLINGKQKIKLLGNGNLTKKIVISVHKVSQSAKLKVEALGGKVNTIL